MVRNGRFIVRFFRRGFVFFNSGIDRPGSLTNVTITTIAVNFVYHTFWIGLFAIAIVTAIGFQQVVEGCRGGESGVYSYLPFQ